MYFSWFPDAYRTNLIKDYVRISALHYNMRYFIKGILASFVLWFYISTKVRDISNVHVDFSFWRQAGMTREARAKRHSSAFRPHSFPFTVHIRRLHFFQLMLHSFSVKVCMNIFISHGMRKKARYIRGRCITSVAFDFLVTNGKRTQCHVFSLINGRDIYFFLIKISSNNIALNVTHIRD